MTTVVLDDKFSDAKLNQRTQDEVLSNFTSHISKYFSYNIIQRKLSDLKHNLPHHND